MPFNLELRGGTLQPQGQGNISQKWRDRGLVFLSLGNGRYWSKDKGWQGIGTVAGSPKNTTGRLGVSKGFGSTLGTGTTDRIDAGKRPASTALARSIVAHVYFNGAGGGSLGRVFQDSAGTGVDNGDDAVWYFSGTLSYVRRSSGGTGQWRSSSLPTGWSCTGISLDESATGTTPAFYVDGVSSAAIAYASTSGSYINVGTNLTWGNRSSDNARNWDGLIGPVAFFDALLTANEHRSLAANIWQIFEEEDFGYYAAAGGGSYTLTADSGSFALTGQDAGLSFNRVLAADTQSYTLTGQDAGLAFNRTLAAESGSFSLNGQDAGLAFNRVLGADNGSFALDGQDVTLTYTPISGATYTLGAASGSFALTGQDTGLAFNRVLAAETQSYSLDGQTAGLAFNRVLTADTISYALTGQDAALTYTGNTYTLNAESGTFFVDGQDANLVYSGGSSVDTGDGSMSRKRYYLRRKGKILLFDTAAQADDYLEAEEEAQKAIATAKSRGAKKRIAAKILKAVEPVESVEIAPLQEMVKAYSVPVDLPTLLKQNDYSQVMKVREMIQRMLDDEDDELLLLLA